MLGCSSLKNFNVSPVFIAEKTLTELACGILKWMLLLFLVGVPLAFGQQQQQQQQQGKRRTPTTRQAVIADEEQAIPGSTVTGSAANDITLSVDPPSTGPIPE